MGDRTCRREGIQICGRECTENRCAAGPESGMLNPESEILNPFSATVDGGRPAGAPGLLHVDLERAMQIEAATSLNTTLLKIRIDVTEWEFDPSDSALVAIQLGVAREHALALAEEIAELLETRHGK
jgi:hypothetical protein